MDSEKLMGQKPGISSTIETMIFSKPSNSNVLLGVGLGLSRKNQQIFDGISNVFSGKLHLKYLMGFAADYSDGILNTKQ